jgi:ArsR family metal-binding transcriptional regulator
MHTATKAMIKLLGLANRKRRGFFVVKGTAGRIICTGFFERHISLDDIHDVETIKQILNKALRDHANTAFALRPANAEE